MDVRESPAHGSPELREMVTVMELEQEMGRAHGIRSQRV
jgi:hypothetical protein